MTIYIRLEKPCKRDEMLNNNVRRLRDESLLNFALCVFRWHVGCVIHTALNTGCKVAVKKFKFLMTLIALTLVRRESIFGKGSL